MSLRESFSTHKTTDRQKEVDAACVLLCRAFARDRALLQQRFSKRKSLLSRWRKTHGAFDDVNNKITYTALSNTQAKSHSFDTRIRMVEAIKKEFRTALDQCGYLRALHATCAMSDVDVRLEVSVDDHFVSNGSGTSYRQADITVVMYLDQPYAHSSKKLASLPAPPPAPAPDTRTMVVERVVRDPKADAALRVIKGKDAAALARLLQDNGWNNEQIAKIAAGVLLSQQYGIKGARVTIDKRSDAAPAPKRR